MLFIFLISLCASAYAQVQVHTTEGVVQGSRAGDGDYNVFYGIPYAGPTEGENRFKAPTPALPYPSVFHAMTADIICAQPTANGLIGVENCLTLSIFTNNVTTQTPVLVWLNAEEYTTSSAIQHSFKKFIEDGLVVVTLNFRLSVFGFLCLGVPEAPGNAGIKDIIQGLEWIQSNIAGFGGNPNNVALMGHGSAAALVDIITLTPRAQNLVHKAIALSGSVLAPWAISYTPIQYAVALGERLSYVRETRSRLATLLAGTQLDLLARPLHDFRFRNNSIIFAPCIEIPLENDTSVLTEAPSEIFKSGNYSHIPYIAAYVTREGTQRAEEAEIGNWLELMDRNFTEFLQVDLDFGTNRTVMSQTIRQHYFGSSAINMGTIQDYLDYFGDTLVFVSMIRGVRARALTSTNETRLMEFGYMGTKNSDWMYNQVPLSGVRHGAIKNYLFDYDLLPNDEVVMKSVLTRLTNFVHTGVPSLNTPTTINVTNDWLPITRERMYYLQYAGSAQDGIYDEQIKFDPHTIKMSFWDQIYSQYYVLPPTVSSASQFGAFFYVMLFSILFVRLF